tara:strand:+ start:1021 stop:1149 length:129 start_codon:yes stop_codon:yes gene_type:complete
MDPFIFDGKRGKKGTHLFFINKTSPTKLAILIVRYRRILLGM